MITHLPFWPKKNYKHVRAYLKYKLQKYKLKINDELACSQPITIKKFCKSSNKTVN